MVERSPGKMESTGLSPEMVSA